jgi:hypothetical protein
MCALTLQFHLCPPGDAQECLVLYQTGSLQKARGVKSLGLCSEDVHTSNSCLPTSTKLKCFEGRNDNFCILLCPVIHFYKLFCLSLKAL